MKNNPLPKWKFILTLNVHGVITIAALFGSYFVLRAFLKFRNLRTASNNILVSLSIANGLLAIPSILEIIHLCLVYNVGHRSRILTEVGGTVTLFLLSVIVLHLTLVSSDGFITIKYAQRYHSIVTKRRARIVSIAMWLWALVVIVAFPEMLQRTTGKDFRKFRGEMNAVSNTSQVLHIRWHLVFQAASMFLVLLLMILCSSVYIFIVSYKQRQHVKEQGRDVTGTPAIKHEMIGARSLAIIVALCLLSIIPILVVTSLRVFLGISLGGLHHQKLLQQIVYDVAMFVNAICIPLITAWKNEEFRNAFRKILKCC